MPDFTSAGEEQNIESGEVTSIAEGARIEAPKALTGVRVLDLDSTHIQLDTLGHTRIVVSVSNEAFLNFSVSSRSRHHTSHLHSTSNLKLNYKISIVYRDI